MKRGRCMCGTFKAFKLTYLHVLRSYIYLSGIPDLRVGNQPPSCINLDNCLYDRTNVPLSSARLPTFFHHPLLECMKNIRKNDQLLKSAAIG